MSAPRSPSGPRMSMARPVASQRPREAPRCPGVTRAPCTRRARRRPSLRVRVALASHRPRRRVVPGSSVRSATGCSSASPVARVHHVVSPARAPSIQRSMRSCARGCARARTSRARRRSGSVSGSPRTCARCRTPCGSSSATVRRPGMQCCHARRLRSSPRTSRRATSARAAEAGAAAAACFPHHAREGISSSRASALADQRASRSARGSLSSAFTRGAFAQVASAGMFRASGRTARIPASARP